MHFIIGVIVGVVGSYYLSDTMRKRWLLAAATYDYMTESEKRFYAYMSQRIYQMYLNGDLKRMIENVQKMEDCLEPPEDYVRAREADILARMAGNGGSFEPTPRNVTPGSAA